MGKHRQKCDQTELERKKFVRVCVCVCLQSFVKKKK